MSVFLDTSVLVPIFLAEHQHHQESLRVFSGCSRGTAYCAAHSLAEAYSTLTRLPAPHRATPDEALLFVDDILARLSPIGLEAAEHVAALRDAAAFGIAGGAVYDFLISRCAVKIGAEVLYTWNSRHYRQFGAEVERIMRVPGVKV